MFVHTFSVIGAAWMAPEVLQTDSDGKQAVTNAADVYMFGCYLLEIITGEDPWFWFPDPPGSSLHAYRIANPSADPASECRKAGHWTLVVQKDVDTDTAFGEVWMLEKLIAVCLNADHTARPSMDEVVDTLDYMAAPRGVAVPERTLMEVVYAAASDFVPSVSVFVLRERWS